MADGGAIGRSIRRSTVRKLAFGRGKYADDLRFPGLRHAAFVRSPHAHARILRIAPPDSAGGRVVTGAELARICKPMQGTVAHLPGLVSPPQYPMAVDRAVWQGEPVAAVVASSRAEAEDLAEQVVVDYEPLPAAAVRERALDDAAHLVHPALGNNLCFANQVGAGDVEAALAGAAHVVAHSFSFARQTGVPLEPRGVIADFDPGERRLTIHGTHQSPWQQQDSLAHLLGLPDHAIRVVTPDIGGGFGIKLHVYGDEVAVAALSMLLGKPIKYVADRLESFLGDIHARDQAVEARIGVDADGRLLAMSVDALTAVGAYSAYRRSAISEGMMTVNLAAGAYALKIYSGRLRAVFQNKPPSGMYRAVGQPIACAVTEQMLDWAAQAAGIDPLEIRRRNHHRPDAYPVRMPSGVTVTPLSLDACLDTLVSMMDYPGQRRRQAAMRASGVHRGIGVATFLEMTSVGPTYYGPAGSRVSTQDGATVRLEPSGAIRCVTSAVEIGQGTLTGIAQIVADRLGVAPEDVSVYAGDTAMVPYGGGAWASRGLTICGEAAWRAADALGENILRLAGTVLQSAPEALALAEGFICDRATGARRMSLAELATIGHFRQDTLPPDTQPELAATRHHVPDAAPFALANGVQASLVEVDIETGAIRLLEHWVVEDCGRMVNPLLVDEQIRGGVVQGIGGALFEECRYDADGQMLNATLADYLVPMAGELPDIHIGHVETPNAGTRLGAKGAGEAGTVGAAPAVMLAVNDALSPIGARIDRWPMTPETVLNAIAAAPASNGSARPSPG